jgi:hypothetical protein
MGQRGAPTAASAGKEDTMRAWIPVIALVMASGCHAKFHKYAPTLGAVRPQVVMAGGPTVQIGGSGNVIVDVANGVRAADVAQKIDRQVAIDQVNDAFSDGLDDTLGDGPPFGVTDAAKAPTLQVEVVNYGLYVPEMGAQGELVYDLRVRIYTEEGERVYSTSLRCESPVEGADAISAVLGTRDNIGNVLDLRKREIQAAFDSAGDECGRELVTKMRRHAG